jgi:DNA-binding response OmpR family regulator/Tfp pilus assembly protein PilZ
VSTELVVCAGLEQAAERAVGETAAELDLELRTLANLKEAKRELEPTPPLCAVVDCASPLGSEAALALRMSSKLVDTPVVAVVAAPWSQELLETFALGVDDYVPAAELGLLRDKLVALRGGPGGAALHLSGRVVLADSDRERRVHLARHLRKMGLQVDFAVSGVGLPDEVAVKLVVASCDLPPDGAARALQQFRTGPGVRIPWVLVGTSEELAAARALLDEQPGVNYTDRSSDPARIVFTANQLMIGSVRSMRRSPRLSYESAVRFELLGETAAPQPQMWGYSYNINRGGLYIRTLTPPALGQDLSLEILPPHGRGHAIVDAKVVWRQEYAGSKGYPPGVGVEYAPVQALPDAAALEAGYTKLLDEHGNPDA